MHVNRNSYHYCKKCKEFHQLLLSNWEFRTLVSGERVPYRCKMARRLAYKEGRGDKVSKVYYRKQSQNQKNFIVQRKRLRRDFNRGNLSEAEFDEQLAIIKEIFHAKEHSTQGQSP